MEDIQAKTEHLRREAHILNYLSLYLVLFFSWVFVAYRQRWDAPLVGVVWELLMIPSLIMLVVLPLLSVIRFFRAPVEFRRTYLLAFLLQVVAILIVVVLSLKS